MSKKVATGGAPVKIDTLPKPEFWPTRAALFDALYAEQQRRYEAQAGPIKVTLPDGKEMEAKSWVTTPIEIAKRLSNSLPDKVFAAKVNGSVWDLTRPLEGDATLELLDWEEPESRKVFWHSSAHVLGYALERVFGCKLSVGPPLEDGGFFYEGDTHRPVGEGDYAAIEAAMQELVRAKAPYQRLVLSKEDAVKMFGYNDFKHLILSQKVPEHGTCTVYRCGDLIDPCKGPHLPDTGRVKAFSVTKNSSSYFQGKAENATLQRVYAISFPKDAQLKEWKIIQEEASKRDHRVIGKQQELFQFHEVSPGSAFWLPHGMRIYNRLIEFQRAMYRRRGFEEVLSPNIYSSKLWMVSGHWQFYRENMFQTTCEHEEFALKPMNCPGHCMMFGMRPRSYKELPIRFAEFGVLHRNELSGALTGLTRVRRFQQDDAHIFCRGDQVTAEIESALDFLKCVYDVFGFKLTLKLSTKPEKAFGTDEQWKDAEKQLADSLNHFCGIPPDGFTDPTKSDGSKTLFDGTPAAVKKLKTYVQKAEKSQDSSQWTGPVNKAWEINPGDGAFYGPKIDITVEDALKRKHQCATLQLDFNLPERFGLRYTLPGPQASAAPAATETPKESVAPVPASKSEEVEVPKAEVPGPAPHQPAGSAPVVSEVDAQLHIDRTLDPNQARPLIIHRAIFGSLERFIAILCENYGGKWPFWISPRQAIVVPVSQHFDDYAREVKAELHGAGFHADADLTSGSLDKKIRNAQLAQYNFILVVGQQEVDAKSVSVRTRDNKVQGAKSIAELLAWLNQLAKSYATDF